MRILQVITDTDRRGAQVFATDLGEALGRRGHDVTTVALGPGRHTPGLPHRVLGRRRRSVTSLRRLHELLREHDVGIAHGSTTLPASALAALGTSTPWVYRQISESLFWAPSRARRARVSAGLSRATIVVTLAASQGEVLTEHFGVAHDRIRVVPNGVPSARFTVADAADQKEARQSFGLATDAPVVAYVGALALEKGVDVAVEAVAAVPGLQLLIAGDGPQRSALHDLAARCAPRRVHFVGVLDDVTAAYAAADVVVLPSRGGDSMPAALIEAGLSGRPAVATSIGAIPEVVVPGATGELVPVGDPRRLARALEALVADPDELARLGAAARERALQRFDIDVVAAGWEAALYDAVTLKFQ
jgi:glycosyltransferase involved in cell wall biosynthesis